MSTQITNSAEETQEAGKKFAMHLFLLAQNKQKKKATILGLKGNLGGGKTTFLQGFARGLGIKEKILSPTFVIMKKFGNFYHIDCYRINKPEEILELGWEEIINNPKNIVAIEWPEKVKKLLPKGTRIIKFKLIDENTRQIVI
jgi:tRNA threonylcarbamoyladenosine biosynthesis protein TsaE